MVPDKFNMVDMEGIDIIESQGVEVPGLYQKLVESIARCRYQCLYNWKFDGILIPPTYVEMTATDEAVLINGGVSVDVDDIIQIDAFVVPPVIEALAVSENGVYTPEEGVDGFAPVEVEINPVIESLEVSENGVYVAPEGVDGYSPVTVSLPSPEYEVVAPVYSDLSYGYITPRATFARDSSKIHMSNLYEVASGDFVAFQPPVTGNVTRILFFAGKTLSDFSQYLENSGSGDVYYATRSIVADSSTVTRRDFFSVAESGVVYIMTSLSSQTVESILLKINS